MFKRIISFTLGIFMLFILASSPLANASSKLSAAENSEVLKLIQSQKALNQSTRLSKLLESRKTFEEAVGEFKSENVSADIVGASGECGEGVSWSLSSGKLTISGNGYMYDYEITLGELAPWLENYESIKSVTIKSGVKNIGNQAFLSCVNLTSVSIPSTVEYIGEYSFQGCTALSTITIPEGVSLIGTYAFSGSGIKSLNIPASVMYIDSATTSYCPNLKTISVNSSNKYYKSKSNCIIDKEDDYIIAACEGSSIPEGDIYFDNYSIGSFSFMGIQSLKNIYIPANIMNVAEGAFIDCSNIETISVDPENEFLYAKNNVLVQKSTSSVVLGCKNSVIPNDETILGIKDFAFYNCNISSDFIIPRSITKFGAYSFYGCKNLIVYKLGDNITKIGAYAFDETKSYNLSSNWYNDGVMYLGKCAVSVRPDFAKEYCDLKEGTVLMADELFSGHTQIKSAKFPMTMKHISDYAFAGCISLSTVEFSPLIETIGTGAFAACTSLTTLEMPEFLETIKEGAFTLCLALEEVSIDKYIKTIEDGAFAHCPLLNKITIKSNKVEIGEYALGYNMDEETGEPVKNDSLVIYCNNSSNAARYARSHGFTIKTLPQEVKDPLYINVKLNTLPNVKEKTTFLSFRGDFLLTHEDLIISATKKGAELSENDYLSTGCVLTTTKNKVYTVIVNGDVDGSGTIDSTDYLQIKKVFLNEMTLADVYSTAADTNADGTIDATDYLQIKQYFLGTYDLYK